MAGIHARRKDHSAQRGNGAGDHKQLHLDLIDVDTGQTGCLRVSAHQIHIAAKLRFGQQNAEDRDQHHQDQHRQRNRQHLKGAHGIERLVGDAHRLNLTDDVGKPPGDGHGRQRGDKWLQLDLCHQKSVQQAKQQASGDGDGQDRPQGQTVPRQNRRQYAGERRHRSCRQLDHAGNNQIGLADAQQTHQRSGGQDIQHITI